MTNENRGSQTELCMRHLDRALTVIRAEGVDPVFIIPAMGEVCAKIAKAEPDGAAWMESLAAILHAQAQAMRGKNVMNMAKAIFGSEE